MELVRSMIDHKKVLVLALNGPGVGAGAAWFQGSSDLFYAAEGSWLQVTFSQMGLVPENGSAQNWADHMGVHRANEWLMLGGKASVEELKEIGMVNKIFPKEGFHEAVHQHLKDILKERSGRSMIITKELQNKRTRDARMLSLFEAWNALAERFVEGEPMLRMKAKMQELAGELKRGDEVLETLLTSVQTRGRTDSRRCSPSIQAAYAQCTNMTSILRDTYFADFERGEPRKQDECCGRHQPRD